jgi:hypothetical protein
MSRFEFESGTFLWFYYYIFVSFGESCLPVSWCAGDKYDSFSRFGLKTTEIVSFGLALKLVVTVSPSLASKLACTVW